MLTTLKPNLSGFIFTGKMGAPGMAVMKNGKLAALTQLLQAGSVRATWCLAFLKTLI